jgi:membrane protein YdbS with pleckstrin-like domain
MENFTNSILLPKDLPEVESKTFNLLNKKYLRILLLRILILFLFLAGALVTFLLLTEEKPPIFITVSISLAIVLAVALLLAVTILGFPKKGYLVREKDVSYQRGLITYKVTSVPLNRIQHVEVSQGVLEKMLGLSSVKIFTAGGTSSDLSIPGLTVDEAKKVKAYLSGKISEHE